MSAWQHAGIATRHEALPPAEQLARWLRRIDRRTLRVCWLAVYLPIVAIQLVALILGALDPTGEGGVLHPHGGPYAIGLVTLEALVFLWLVVNTSLAAARLTDPVNLYLSIGAMLWMSFVLPETERLAAHPEWATTVRLTQWLGSAFLVPHLLWFPDGRFVPRWSGVVAVVWLAVWGTLAVAIPGREGLLGLPASRVVLALAFVLFAQGAQLYRLRITVDPLVQQQLKWIAYGGLIHTVGSLLVMPARFVEGDLPILLHADVAVPIYVLAPGAVAAAYSVAILRYRLWDIDLIINRTLVYAAATGILVAWFVVLSKVAQAALASFVGGLADLTSVVIALALALSFPWLQRRLRPVVDRFLPAREILTVLFTDIVGSTEVAARLGDERWRSLLERYRALIRRNLHRFHGQEIDTAGDGFLATFRSATQAVRCALAFTADVVELGLQARTSLHQGACEMRGEKVSGLTIHVGARILGLAQAGEILVSRPVSDSVIDKTIRFDERGSHALRGVPDVWSLYAVNARADG